MNLPKSPITLLVESVKSSERMRNVDVFWGARDLPDGGKPERIVIVPTTESHEPPEHNGDWLDALVTVEAHLWGANFDSVRYLRDALIQACFDYQFSTNLLRVRYEGMEWNTAPDTAQQGWAAVLTFSVRDVVEKVPLAANAGSATVDNEQFAPAAGAVGPTLTFP